VTPDPAMRYTHGQHRRRSVLAVRLSLLFHVAGFIVFAAYPGSWPWVAGLLLANYAVLVGAVLQPRGRLLGPNVVRLPASAAQRGMISLTFDDGPDPEVTPRVLDLLDRYQAKASFFCVGAKAAAHAGIVREIIRRGHSVENHSHGHSHAFAFYGLSRLTSDVESAQNAIAGITGQPPMFFRAPAGFRSPLLDLVLASRGLRYVSWTRRGFDALSRDPSRVLERLTRGLAAGDVLLLHDGTPIRATDQSMVLTVLPALLEKMAAKGLTSVSLPSAFDGTTV
jgi:peptidoglycan/xylan/chitin deacetylase (PgdA/CDA1 family)